MYPNQDNGGQRAGGLSRPSSGDYGVRVGKIEIDMGKVRERKRAIVQSFRQGSERRIRETPGLDLLQGEATFVNPNTFEVRLSDGQVVRIGGKRTFINTGGRPAIPPMPGLNEVSWLDSTSIMELASCRSIWSCWVGGILDWSSDRCSADLAAQVTVVQRGEQLLAREDPDVADAVASILREDGVELLLRTEAVRVAKSGKDTTSDGSADTRRRAGAHRVASARSVRSCANIPNHSTQALLASPRIPKGSFVSTSFSKPMYLEFTPWAM